MNFLENSWYCIGLQQEIGCAMLHRTVLGRDVVLFRTEAGEPVALENRCAHRFAPLHLGDLAGDVVECRYHGLRYDRSGACVFNPQGQIPRAARVRRYPVADRHGLVWIWMGEERRAAVSAIPDLGAVADTDDHRPVRGYMHCRANYELLGDNLMDLSHVGYLHRGGLGSDAMAEARTEVVSEGDTVKSLLWLANKPPAPYFSARFDDYADPVDHWLNITWIPAAVMLLDSGITPAGRPREEGISGLACHILTPETEISTHYFWAHTRSYKRQDLEVSAAIRGALQRAFETEDKPMIEAQQQAMRTTDLWSLRPVLLPADAAAVRVRRTLARLIEEEHAARSPVPAEHRAVG